MARLCCLCLNITVNVTGDWRANTVPISTLFSGARPHHLIADHKLLYEVQLDVAGIIVRQGLLALSCQVEDWIITSCGNCHSDVYVSHTVKTDKMFVTPQLLSSPVDIQRVAEQDHYSAIFKILLPPQEEADKLRSRVSSMMFGREDSEMRFVHQQMKDYLKAQDEAMEDRIRLYEKLQRQNFRLLQEKAHQERRTFFSALSAVREKLALQVKRSVAGPGGDSHGNTNRMTTPTLPQVVSITTPKSAPTSTRAVASGMSHDSDLYGVQKELAASSHSVTITLRNSAHMTQVSDVGEQEDVPIFTLDDFDEETDVEYSDPLAGGGDVDPLAGGGGVDPLADEDGVDVAFPQSDDEEISTDDSSFRDISALNAMTYGTSVPVDIPMYHKRPVTANPSSLGDDGGHSDGDGGFEMREVGNCIRQLALSVQDTGMFGDLPKPRIMTNPPTH